MNAEPSDTSLSQRTTNGLSERADNDSSDLLTQDKSRHLQRHKGAYIAGGAAATIAITFLAIFLPLWFTRHTEAHTKPSPSSAPTQNNNTQYSGNYTFGLPDYTEGLLDPNDASNWDDSKQCNPNTPPLNQPFPYGQRAFRGVNIGGWFVLEPFITPSLFEQFDASQHAIDEWTFSATLGPQEAYNQLLNHYQTWVTEYTFRVIARAGLDHVKIPIGHWALGVEGNEPFVPHLAWQFLLKGIQWARKYGLRVMVELHTAPGSQNGWNHSGHVGPIGFLNGTTAYENSNRTLAIVQQMVKYFNDPKWKNVVPMFGMLNEPAAYEIGYNAVKTWYNQSYFGVRNTTNSTDLRLVYHEGFLGLDIWSGSMPKPAYKNVVLDIHDYLIFDQNTISMPPDQQLAVACNNWKPSIANSDKNFGETMVGEFSVATNDCGKFLNGVGLGARYDGTFAVGDPPVCPNCTCHGTEDWRNWADTYKSFLLQFVEYQMDAFENGLGWFFWNFRTENSVNPHWDYFLGLDQGWIPADASQRQHTCADLHM